MVSIDRLVDDLAMEHAALDAIVSDLTGDQWNMATASLGWRIVDQIGHLQFFDEAAGLAISDPERFAKRRDRLFRAAAQSGDPDGHSLAWARASTSAELLEGWRQARRRLLLAASELTEERRLEWFGPQMGAKSFLTARLMETWAHGQDIVDALGISRSATERLRHIAELGFRTRGWSYANRGLAIPDEEVQVELQSLDGSKWTWGDDLSSNIVKGDAVDFCLVVTQRRNWADTGLSVEGNMAMEWMEIAQVFAGSPTDGPQAA